MRGCFSSSAVLCLTLVLQIGFFASYNIDFDSIVVAKKLDLPTGQTIEDVTLNTVTLGQDVYATYDTDRLIVNLGTATTTSSNSKRKNCILVDAKATYRVLWVIPIPVSATVRVCGRASFLRVKAPQTSSSASSVDCGAYLAGNISSSAAYSLDGDTQLTNCCLAETYDPATDCTFTARAIVYNFIPLTFNICKQLQPFFLDTDAHPDNTTLPFPPLQPTATATRDVLVLRVLKGLLDHVESAFGVQVRLSFPDATAVHVRVRQTAALAPPDQLVRIADAAKLLASLPGGGALPPGMLSDVLAIIEQMFGSLPDLTSMLDSLDLGAIAAAARVTNPPLGLQLNFSSALPAGAGVDLDVVFPDLRCSGPVGTTCSVPRAAGGANATSNETPPFYITNVAPAGLSDLDLAVPWANDGITALLKTLIAFYVVPVLPCAAADTDPSRCTLPFTGVPAPADPPLVEPPLLQPGATPLADAALFQLADNVTKCVASVFNVSLRVDAAEPGTALGVSLTAADAVDIAPLLPPLLAVLRGDGDGDGEEAARAGAAGLRGALAGVQLTDDFVPWAAGLVSTVPRGARAAADVFLPDLRCDPATGMDCRVAVTGPTAEASLRVENLRLTNATLLDGLLNSAIQSFVTPQLTTAAQGLLSQLCSDGGDGSGAVTCFLLNTTGVSFAVDTAPLLLPPPPALRSGASALGDVALVALAANLTGDIGAIANLSVAVAPTTGTNLQLVAQTTGALDVLADHYAEARRAAGSLVALAMRALDGAGPQAQLAARVLAAVRLAPFLDEWVTAELRGAAPGRGVRANVFVADVRCNATTQLDCTALVRGSDGAAGVTLGGFQLATMPVLDVLTHAIVPRLAQKVFDEALFPALRGALCGAGSPLEEVQYCSFATTSDVALPALENVTLPALYPNATALDAVPILVAVSNLARVITGIPGVGVDIDFPTGSALQLSLEFLQGLALDLPPLSQLPALLGRLLGPQWADLLTALPATTCTDALGSLTTALYGGNDSHSDSDSDSGAASLLEDVLRSVTFAEECTVGDVAAHFGGMPPGSVFAPVLYVQNLQCDDDVSVCVLLPPPPPPTTRAFEDVGSGVGIAALRLSPSSLLGVVGAAVLPLTTAPLNALVQDTAIPAMCKLLAGDGEAGECRLVIPKSHPLKRTPPLPFMIAYPIAGVTASLLLALGNVLRHRRYGLRYLADGKPVGPLRTFLEDFGFSLLLFFVIGLYIASNTTTAAVVILGGDFEVYSFTMISTVTDMWHSGLKFLAAFVTVFSGIFPYFKLLSLLLCSVVLQLPQSNVLSVVDTVGKFSFIDTFFMLILVSGLQIEGAVAVKSLPSYYLFLGATVGSILAGNYAFDLYRFGTTSRLSRKERAAFLQRWASPAELDAAVTTAQSARDSATAEAGHVATEAAGRSDGDSPPDSPLMDPGTAEMFSMASASAGDDDDDDDGNSGDADVGQDRGGAAEPPTMPDAITPPRPPMAPVRAGVHFDACSSTMTTPWKEKKPFSATTTEAALSPYRAAMGTEDGDEGVGHMLPDDAEPPPAAAAMATRSDTSSQVGGSGSRDTVSQGLKGGPTTNIALAFLKTVWLPFSVPAAAVVLGLTIPSWCVECVSYKVGGLAQVVAGPPRGYTLTELVTGLDGATSTVTVVTILIIPTLYAVAYPRATFLGSWTAADVILAGMVGSLQINTLIQFMLGDKDGSMSFLYSAKTTLHWPVILLAVAALLVWLMQLYHFFELRRRLPRFVRWIRHKVNGNSGVKGGSDGELAHDQPHDLDADISPDEVIRED